MGEKNCSITEKWLLDGKGNPTTEPEGHDKTRFWTFNKNERQRIYALLRKHNILLPITACGIIVVLTVVSMFAFHESTRKSHEVLKNKTFENQNNQQMASQQNEWLSEETNKLQLKMHNIEILIDKLQHEMTKTVQNITDLDKLRNKTDKLEKKLYVIENITASLQYEYTDLEKEIKYNKNLIGNLLNKNNDLVSKMDTLERTTVELKRQLDEMQHYMYSTYSKMSYNGTDQISKPPAWTTILMQIVSFIVLYYGYL